MFLSEWGCLVPFVGLIWQNWSVIQSKEWIAFCCLGLLLASANAAEYSCSFNMNLGEIFDNNRGKIENGLVFNIIEFC